VLGERAVEGCSGVERGRQRLVLGRRVDRADLDADAAAVEQRQPVALERPLLRAAVGELDEQVVVGVDDHLRLRARNSASQARVRSPIQIGVSRT
jgi:hypothetical protein